MKLAPPPITMLPCMPPGVVVAYTEAYGTCAILPGHALVQVRGALAALVEAWLRHLARGTGGTLADQTARLVSLLGLPDAAARAFYDVRVAGNLGAHPEQRRGGLPVRAEARDALFALHGLVSLFAERVGGVLPHALPPFVEPPEVHWGDVCERAVFERDAAAMLAVGRRHRTQALEANRESERSAKAEKSSMWLVDRAGFQDALDWSQRSAINTTDPDVRRQAWFEQARLLLTELPGHKRADEAVELLRWSAEDGVADAQSMLAILILDPRSPLPQPRDLGEAREWAERAATAEHPEALSVLTAIYANGQGVPRDPVLAISCARRASQAGYPQAHANLALLLLDQPPELRDDGEIRSAIDRAKLAGVGHGYWAEFRLLDQNGLAQSEGADEALRAAAREQVVSAMLVCAQRAMRAEPTAWDLGHVGAWLIGVLGSMDAEDERVEAREMLIRVRDEGSRRMRSPDPRAAKRSVDDLFYTVLQAGACRDLQPGQDTWAKVGPVMDALARIGPLYRGQDSCATREDVELLVGAMPDFLVRWTGERAELLGNARASADAMPSFAAIRQADPPEPRAAARMPVRRPARNGPCPCGSGKRFKGCCGRA